MESHLSQISTHQSLFGDGDPRSIVNGLLRRYQKAIRSYLGCILRGHQASEVDDAGHDLVTAVLDGTVGVWNGVERWRDYLKRAVRRFARNYQGPRPAQLASTPEIAANADEEDDQWREIWRVDLLRKALNDLRRFQQAELDRDRDCCFADVLDLRVQNPDSKSALLAEQLSKLLDRLVSAETFRKQLQRAREKLAMFLCDEVRKAHPGWSNEQVDDELRELRLQHIVQTFGPEDMT